MSRNYWVISDTHFTHANILKFTDDKGDLIRNFTNEHEMDEHLIQNWNSVVKYNDYVYHLGDITFKPEKFFTNIGHRLLGKKRLILGNHDNPKSTQVMDFFEKVSLWKFMQGFGFLMTHIPLASHQMRKNYPINLHGHIHQNDSPEPHQFNCCVEKTNYMPLNLEELRDKLISRSGNLK